MKTSLVTSLTVGILLTSCQPSLAIENEFTKPCFISGIGCPHPPPREPGWFDWLFSWTPSQPLPSRDDGCRWRDYGRYLTLLDCPSSTTSSPDDDDRDNDRPYR